MSVGTPAREVMAVAHSEKPLLQYITIEDLATIRWRCGFSGSNAILVETPTGAHLITDRRYEVQAQAEVHGATVHTPGYELRAYLGEAGLLDDATHVGFQPEVRTVAQQGAWEKHFPAIEWVPTEHLYAGQRAAKTPEEVTHIRSAQAITESVFEELLGYIRPGISERALAAELIYLHLKRGAERMAFTPIVASGPNSARPHARPTERLLEEGDVVLMDFGCVVHGYASDMTRTVVLGSATEEMQAVYACVLEAQEAAIRGAQAGIVSKDLDEVARRVIREAGYGEAFAHSLGHGVGLETHEWPPVSFRSEVSLPNQAVVTIEPGIYLPEAFGVRIEDMVQLIPGGCQNLTAAPKARLLEL